MRVVVLGERWTGTRTSPTWRHVYSSERQDDYWHSLGDANPWGARVFTDAQRRRVEGLLPLAQSEQLTRVEVDEWRNLMAPDPVSGAWSTLESYAAGAQFWRCASRLLRGDECTLLLCCGRRVWAALDGNRFAALGDAEHTRLERLFAARVPHPSSRNRQWNPEAAQEAVIAACREALASTVADVLALERARFVDAGRVPTGDGEVG